jgi:hypothetical protein
MLVDLETVQVVGVALQPHQEPSEGHVRGQSARRFHGGFVTLDAVDFPRHDVLEAVGTRTLRFQALGVPVAAVGVAVFAQGCRQDQTELVTWKQYQHFSNLNRTRDRCCNIVFYLF